MVIYLQLYKNPIKALSFSHVTLKQRYKLINAIKS